jgi:hypothetical protein
MVSKKALKFIVASVAVASVAIAIAAGVRRDKQAKLHTSASFAHAGKAGKGAENGVVGKSGKGSKAGSKSGKGSKASVTPSKGPSSAPSRRPSRRPSSSKASKGQPASSAPTRRPSASNTRAQPASVQEISISLARQEIMERSSASRIGTGFLLAWLSTLAAVVGLWLHKWKWYQLGSPGDYGKELGWQGRNRIFVSAVEYFGFSCWIAIA